LIVCKQCGHHNEDNDTFCGSCGKFLEWTGERVAVAEPEPPPPAAEPEPEPVRHGLIDRVKQAVGIEETAATPRTAVDPAPAPAAPAQAAPASATGPAAPRAAAPLRSIPVNSASATTAPEPVLAGVAAPGPPTMAQAPPPVSADEPLSRRPTSVAPTVTRARPGLRRVEQPTRRHAGDLICGQCGEGNDPTRHFCRRCGSELAEAVAVQLPWYRRILNRVFGDRTREAGWRPKRVGAPNVTGMFMRVVRLAIAAVLILAVLAFLLIPPFRATVVSKVTTGVTAVRKLVHPNYDPIHAVGASATSSIPGHLPSLALDTFSNTYWAASANDKAPVLVLRFAGPVDLAEIGVTSGAAGTAPSDAFLAQPRPHQVHLVFSNGYTTDIVLNDSKTAQFNPIDARQVTSVEIHVLSVWAPAGAAPSSVAIAEVEFTTKD
jgi:zinc-ribbon domain